LITLIRRHRLGRVSGLKKADYVEMVFRANDVIPDTALEQVLEEDKQLKAARLETRKQIDGQELARFHVGDRVAWSDRFSGTLWEFGIITKVQDHRVRVRLVRSKIVRIHHRDSISSSEDVSPCWDEEQEVMVFRKTFSFEKFQEDYTYTDQWYG